jgi:cation:H+ antiporter
MRRETPVADALGPQPAGIDEDDLVLEPLKFQPHAAEPSTSWVLLQTGVALVVIFLSSQFFVQQLDALGPALHLSPQLVALLLSPIATELPEILNAVIWVRQGKFRLALGNISGAMMIQATIPSALGLFFTPWILRPALLWAAAVTMLSIGGLWLLMRGPANTAVTGRRAGLSAGALALFGMFYLLFAAGLAWLPH